MNKHLLTCAAAFALIFAGGGCDDYNDNFDGLQEGTVVKDVKNIEMTLTEADYKAISSNKANVALAKADDESKELGYLATDRYFSRKITAAKYVPNYLAALYPTADNTSAVKVTSNVRNYDLPATVTELQSAAIVALNAGDYQLVWGEGSEYNFFTPSESAAKHLPAILNAGQQQAAEGDMLWVDYNVAETEPSSSVTAFTEDFEAFATAWVDTWSNVVTNGNEKSAKWVVKTYSGNTYIQCSSYKTEGVTEVYAVSPAIDIEKDMTFTFDACYGNYREQGGRLAVLISADLTEETVTAEGIKGATWTDITDQVSIPVPDATYGTLGNVCSYKMDGFAGKSVRIAFRYDGEVPSATTTVQIDNPTVMQGVKTPYTTSSQLCRYDGSAWSFYSKEDVRAIVKADYLAMGSRYDSFDASFKADDYLPALLRGEKPYAQPDASMYVAYKYYDSSSKTRSVRADEYLFDGSAWVKNDNIEEQTDQFIKSNNKWVWDPSVTIVLMPGKNQPVSTLYFQACVDWVKENVEDGAKYVSSYGNNDYYSGASAYQGNLDWRPNSAREQYEEAFEGLTDDQVKALLKERTIEVFGHVLAQLHPDAKPVEGVDVFYNIQLGIYEGSTISAPTHQLTFKVSGAAEFEFVSFTEL